MRDKLEDAVDSMQKNGAEYADIRFESFDVNRLEIQDRKVEEITTGRDEGIGIRAFYKGFWGFSSTNDMGSIKEASKKAVRSAKALHKNSSREGYSLKEYPNVEKKLKQRADIPPGHMEMEQKLALLEDAERTIRNRSKKIKSAKVSYSDSQGRYIFVNSEGSFIEKNPTHFSIYCHATAKSGDRTETHLERSASINGLEHLREVDPVSLAEKAGDMSVKIVEAPRPPTGGMPVVLGDKLGGLFAHEAVGHASEADTVLAGDSTFEGIKGEKVGSEEITVVDDPTKKENHGSYRFDDEGVEAKRTEIIKDGVFDSFLHSKQTCSRMDVEPTGNGRAQSFSSSPLARMSNTFFEKGNHSKDEIMESIDEGLYLKGFKGGQVATAEGKFTFGTTHAYKIKDGEVQELVRGPSISGKTLEILRKIEMVGKDMNIGDPGYCGKSGQTVYVDTGSPHMKVEEMVVG
ncbi:MAG: TldD/PmbA family protein [Candidatus Nanohaloarchaea archaeon]|nr:TldD/PmbA family protein [Candidatus Nanohaloarchaea archaeon]